MRIYPFPDVNEKSKKYSVYINGEEIFAKDEKIMFNWWDKVKIIHQPQTVAFASFSMEGTVSVLVKADAEGEIKSVKIQPESKGITARIEEGRAVFEIKECGQYTVTVNGKQDDMLILFANPMTVFEREEDTIYFGPGVHHITDNEQSRIYLKSGQTLIIDEGAIVYGRIYAENCENISIKGYGNLCGSKANARWNELLRPIAGVKDTSPGGSLLYLVNCKNVELDGVAFTDAPGWTVHFLGCENVRVNNIKVIGQIMSSDGIDICSSRNVTVENSFVRTSDDCIVLKAFKDRGNTENIRARHCVLWADRASALEIGHELKGNDIHDAVFSDIDILNVYEPGYGYHAIDITNTDIGDVYDITYEDIRVEDCTRFIGFRMRRGYYSDKKMPGLGQVHDIYLKNISCAKKKAIFLSGRDEEHIVHNITFEDITVAGEKLTSLSELYKNLYVDGVKLIDNGVTVDTLKKERYKFTPLDISSMCNMTIGREEGVYSLQDEAWVTMPGGINEWEGVPFNITTQGYDEMGNFKRVVIPPERIQSQFPAILTIDEKSEYLFFMHTTVNTYSPVDKICGVYRVTYEDGAVTDIKIRNMNDSNDIYTGCLAGWQPVWDKLKFYIMPWKNPFPKKRIRSVEMLDGEIHEMQILLAITLGEKIDL